MLCLPQQNILFRPWLLAGRAENHFNALLFQMLTCEAGSFFACFSGLGVCSSGAGGESGITLKRRWTPVIRLFAPKYLQWSSLNLELLIAYLFHLPSSSLLSGWGFFIRRLFFFWLPTGSSSLSECSNRFVLLFTKFYRNIMVMT